MGIAKSTAKYEAWLARRTPLIEEDLDLKHREMAADSFRFLRATFYRWCEIWPRICPEAAHAPAVLAVGDLHVENFGTWRDVEGRLVWGVNDFDEVCPMPYTIDLVRLAASAHLAIASNHLSIGVKDACDAILAGYREGLARGGAPIVLGEHHHWLRQLAASELRDPIPYWQKMEALPTFKGKVPKSAVRALEQMMPEKGLQYRLVHRIAGLGSLGRQRFVALADWRGGKIAREAKALVPSAHLWAGGRTNSGKIFYEEALREAVRAPDPFVELRGRWIVRRLAPDCSRIELAALPKERDESRLLFEMGHETANVHLSGRRAVKAILRDLKQRRGDWLHKAAVAMSAATEKDWEGWRAHASKKPAGKAG
ncbi:MAG TPA: DUF2252 family protein [Terriglobia bacterium]|nr:DUF2252 family protein [Terriglobia bacterium]